MIVLISIPILVTILTLVNSTNEDYYITQDNIAMMQLRKILLLSYDAYVQDNEVNFTYKGEDWTLYVSSGNNLILGNGSQVFLHEVEDVSFRQEDNCIFISYTRKNQKYEFNIGKAQGLYISDFPDCVSNDSDDNNSE